ncbi:MAG: NUDIX domain-containing protein [Cellulosilyticum sp.]|nr:NUDIX domain-containing protein [Cellulosilyticum sp.]
MDRHYTVSVYIVHKNKVLLHKHKKAEILLPVGGHIEENELPEEAAVREAFEEAGISVKLHDLNTLRDKYVDTEREKMLINPMHMVLGEIEQGHEHIDFVFYAESESNKLFPGKEESNILKWYSESELDDIKNELLDDIYLMAKEAIKYIKRKY